MADVLLLSLLLLLLLLLLLSLLSLLLLSLRNDGLYNLWFCLMLISRPALTHGLSLILFSGYYHPLQALRFKAFDKRRISQDIVRFVFYSLTNIWSMQIVEYSVILVDRVIKGKNRQDYRVVNYCTVSSLSYLMISIFISPANIAEIPSGILSREILRSQTRCLTFLFGWRYMPPSINYFLQ